MKRRAILAGLFVVFLSSIGHLEAQSFGRASGGHARGFGHFGHHGGRAFGLGIHTQKHLGYHFGQHGGRAFALGIHDHIHLGHYYRTHKFRGLGFGLGYYAPFYSYSNGYRARDYETFPSLRVYSGDYASQRYRGDISKRLNCRDAWAGESPSNSLSSTIRLVFALQCENQHQANAADLPPTKDGLGAESNGKVDPPSELTPPQD